MKKEPKPGHEAPIVRFLNEFKTFAMRGNVIDLAVGVIIGSSFTAIVQSLVNDLVMPLLSLLTTGVDFGALKIPLGPGADAPTLNFGGFLSAVVNFALIALAVFCFIKLLNSARKRLEPAPPPAETPRTCPHCRQIIDREATRCPYCTSPLETERRAGP
ncbi:MAG: large conductance mechanosensitive channel protein MscL [Christensenellaceae bacterium]|jgi:large conductance mechanosensitive channel|nr:large conductance mechanosensitive channel protein MscL [Christensenellaceae bacterium]